MMAVIERLSQEPAQKQGRLGTRRGGRQVQGLCRSMQARRQHQPATQEALSAPGESPAQLWQRAGRGGGREPAAGEVLPAPRPGSPNTPASWGSRGPSLGQGCWSWGFLGAVGWAVSHKVAGGWALATSLHLTGEKAEVPGREPPPWPRCHVDPGPGQASPDLAVLPPPRLACPHPEFGLAALLSLPASKATCLELSSVTLAPGLSLPRMSQPTGPCSPEGLLTAPPLLSCSAATRPP